MLLFDNDNSFKLPTTRKNSQLSKNHPIKSINDFYSNAEDNDEDDIDQQSALRASSHALEIELYIKQGLDKSTNSDESLQEEYNPLSFWKNMHSSYSILSKIAARVFSVPASSAAVEREFSLAGNIVTQKRSTLSPDVVNDMVFNHSYKVYQQGLDNTDKFELH
ncbi:unnamed protein product [Rotaria sordida]|uniref:HAT C-terminal dimerisation domain-containing protein n=1 Tax=Rotaria sordida TaxID=392033 RepID=A0A814HZL7_9BILA|nr:unnamed protein product [Rotaria sordida]CAF3662474.1 unnamed protein product [Rotaria sordida]